MDTGSERVLCKAKCVSKCEQNLNTGEKKGFLLICVCVCLCVCVLRVCVCYLWLKRATTVLFITVAITVTIHLFRLLTQLVDGIHPDKHHRPRDT